MKGTIDPRLAERRRKVLEERARGGVRRVIWLTFFLAVVGAIGWLVQSPLLDIDRITVVGNERANVEAALVSAGIELGGPLLFAPVNNAEETLRADPWIADVAVDRLLPDTVDIRIIEHRPVAVVRSEGQAWTISSSAVSLAATAAAGLPVIELSVAAPELGSAFEDARIVGAAQFFDSLDPISRANAVLFEVDGELWVQVRAYVARLGRPIEMPQKAAALQAVLDDGPPEGAVINVIAPTRPTVRTDLTPPQPSTNS